MVSAGIGGQYLETMHLLCVLSFHYVGECYIAMSSNAYVHGLLHLPEVITKLGPLWAHSCFPFEAANGNLLLNMDHKQWKNKCVPCQE